MKDSLTVIACVYVCAAFVHGVISTGGVPTPPPGEDKPAFPQATCVCGVSDESRL